MKKAQMEIIGLAFIVIIIVFGLLFYIKFTGDAKAPNKQVIEYKELGEATETAMLDTVIPICGYELRTAIQNCVSAPYLTCGQDNICESIHDAMNNMLSNTLEARGEDYRAYIRYNNKQILEKIGEIKPSDGSCNENSNYYATPSQPISTNQGPVYFVIEFCS